MLSSGTLNNVEYSPYPGTSDLSGKKKTVVLIRKIGESNITIRAKAGDGKQGCQ